MKRVREFGRAGALKTREEKNPDTQRDRTVFHAGDVERLREERKNRVRLAHQRALATMPGGPPVMANGGNIVPSPGSVGAGAHPGKCWLTIEQAAEQEGLPATLLRRLIEKGRLPALDIYEGSADRRGWRIHRADLEALRGS